MKHLRVTFKKQRVAEIQMTSAEDVHSFTCKDGLDGSKAFIGEVQQQSESFIAFNLSR